MAENENREVVTITKWKYYLQLFVMVMTTLAFLYTQFKDSINQGNLSFDDQTQKTSTVGGAFTPEQKTRLEALIMDDNRHMQIGEKTAIALDRERQIVLKDDVLQIHKELTALVIKIDDLRDKILKDK